MGPKMRSAALAFAAWSALAARPVAVRAGTAPARPYAVTEARDPCADFDALRRPYFGDLHVHTAFSQDASTQGTRNRPRDAYRFARGEPLGIQPYRGDRPLRTLRLAQPLDFVAVTDHAEQLGEVSICSDPRLEGYGSWACLLYRRFPRAAFFVMNTIASSGSHPERMGFCGEGGARCLAAAGGVWREIQAAAEAAYDRSSACRFTSFVGYEWTGGRLGKNLHRNVLFRNAVVPALPTSNFETQTPQGLWAALRRDCDDAGTGCESLTIPHNSNLSGGLMFLPVEDDGGPLTAAGAAERARFEPLVEIMQHKGDSECLPEAGVQDELCDFEKLPYDAFSGKFVGFLRHPPEPSGFVRSALLQGLAEEARIGVNPFRYGIVASTDTHLGAAGAVSESGYPGHGGAGAPAAESLPEGLTDDLEFNPGGLAVLWAEENSRDALFAAMRRREAYGTSGPRIVVRFFGGYGLPENLCGSPRFAEEGYERGVPMGGVLPPPPAGALPSFAVWALRDPGTPEAPGAPLQRVQIVKGWLEDGRLRQRVLDVAGNPRSDASVDLSNCTPRGEGADQLCTVWRDADFEPELPAFYYARVVENPTCRWSARQCVAHGVDCSDPAKVPAGFEPCCSEDHHWTVQERAWTSPIWTAPRSAE
jgi:Protein of unknown function (DUF3604)